MRFAFMAGLPRSGSSLLTALLNQRDDVYASTLSYGADILNYLDVYISNDEKFRAGATSQRDSVTKNLFKCMYSDKKVNLVIDKSRSWGTPYYREKLLDIFDGDIKIIFPIRPLKEIVASFINLANNNSGNYIDSSMQSEDFYPFWMKPIDDARTDWLLKPNGHISTSMLSLHGAFIEENSRYYHLIQYKSLCLETIPTMRKVENFLDIPEFEYNLSEIFGEELNDLDVYGIENMHKIKKTIQYSQIDCNKILSNYAISRCELEDFWTNRVNHEI